MLYFPLFEFTIPEWVPFKGGEFFTFFSPVFNIADSSIFIGVVMILIFQKKFFKHEERPHPVDEHKVDVVETPIPEGEISSGTVSSDPKPSES
jgi:signal peptidase II